MKKLIFSAFASVVCLGSYAQTNLLTDPGFENLKTGYSGFVTPSSGKVTGMTGKWQMIMAKGGCPDGCAKGAASVVTGKAKSGNNAVEVRIDTQVNRNDIKLFQSIANVPAGVYEVSASVKASVESPIALDILRSSQQSTNNGAAPYTGNFVATKEWQVYKFTVDISDWSNEDRNDLRVSLRLNNNKALPVGPYPKTFWIDDVSLVKVN